MCCADLQTVRPTFPWLAEAYIASSGRGWKSCPAADSLGVVSPGMPQRSISLFFEHVTVEGPLLCLAALFLLPRFALISK